VRRALLLAVAVACVAATWPGSVATAGAQDDDRFALGVLRRDGVLLPFAFDGRRWSTPWPADLRQDLPITIERCARSLVGPRQLGHPP
jgi:hypothetical protein